MSPNDVRGFDTLGTMPEKLSRLPEVITRPGQTTVEILLGVYALGEDCAKSVAMHCWNKLPPIRRLEIQTQSAEMSGGSLAAGADYATNLLVLEFANNKDLQQAA